MCANQSSCGKGICFILRYSNFRPSFFCGKETGPHLANILERIAWNWTKTYFFHLFTLAVLRAGLLFATIHATTVPVSTRSRSGSLQRVFTSNGIRYLQFSKIILWLCSAHTTQRTRSASPAISIRIRTTSSSNNSSTSSGHSIKQYQGSSNSSSMPMSRASCVLRRR